MPKHPSMASQAVVASDNEHLKAMWAGQSNVLVSVRVRPLMKHDIIKKSCVRVLDSKVVVVLDPALGDKQDILRANRSREKQYAFDYVFDTNAGQEHIYNHTAKFLIHGVLDGFNATVFAYGQTGCGKTHTMIGSTADPGIMVRVMQDLFKHAAVQGAAQGVQYKVTVSFLEVYNENIRDLLSDVEEYLDLREDPIKGPVVSSITEIETTSSDEIMSLLHQGNSKRSQAATAANDVSSRSHAVLQVVVESRDRVPGTVANIKVGKLSLVDLAGSERAANTKNSGQRLVEGANINRSLLALGNCINALGEKGNKGNFVPYRDSKLTRLLKDSLGGNCRTVMIANISSAESSFEETLNTLKYANRAKNIKTNIQRNVLNVNYHISEYVELINNLRSEIQSLKSQIATNDGGLPERVLTSHQAVRGSERSTNTGGESPFHHRAPSRNEPSTPFQALRESLRSGTRENSDSQREQINQMRQRIVDNFQERMQLRRSLIELEDKNVQNSIEVSKRQLIVVQWTQKYESYFQKRMEDENGGPQNFSKADFAAFIHSNGTPEVNEAWQECEQLRKAIVKNNSMKKNISRRLRHNEKEADGFREELNNNLTDEDRKELMALQYQVGRLELENMELEQHRIVHESTLKGKDLVIQKLRLQLVVRDKLVQRQQMILREHDLEDKICPDQLALIEDTIMGNDTFSDGSPNPRATRMITASPPRNMADLLTDLGDGTVTLEESLDSSASRVLVPKLKIDSVGSKGSKAPPLMSESEEDEEDFEVALPTDREVALTSRDRDIIEQGDWSEVLHTDNAESAFSLGAAKLKAGGRSAKEKPTKDNTKESSVVRATRGGRTYRHGSTNNIAADDGYRGRSEDYSDDERHGKYKHYSPRREGHGKNGVSDPFPDIRERSALDDIGVLSGRKYDRDNHDPRHGGRDVSPRPAANDAVIYPSISKKGSRNAGGSGSVGPDGPDFSTAITSFRAKQPVRATDDIDLKHSARASRVSLAAQPVDGDDNFEIGQSDSLADGLVVKSRPFGGVNKSVRKLAPAAGGWSSGLGGGASCENLAQPAPVDLGVLGSGIEGTGISRARAKVNRHGK